MNKIKPVTIARIVYPTVFLLALGALMLGQVEVAHMGSDTKESDAPDLVADFSLKDTAGTTHTLKQYRGNIVVLEFASQHCPFSRGADPDLIALAKKHQDDGVVFLAIDSHRSTTPEQIKAYADNVGKFYPILKDVDNKYADTMNAKVTPEMFVVAKDGTLAYHGAFDNRRSPTGEADTPYTANAIQALLKGEPVAPKEVKAWGCSIKRK